MEGLREQGGFLAGRYLVFDTGLAIHDAQVGQICHAVERRIFFPTEEIKGDVFRDLKEKCFGGLNGLGGFCLPNPQV